MDPALTVVCTVTNLQKAALQCNKNYIILLKGDNFEMRTLRVEMRKLSIEMKHMNDSSICLFVCYLLISCLSALCLPG